MFDFLFWDFEYYFIWIVSIRYPLPADVISMIIGRLRTDDIYGQVRAYPRPEHRSTALSTQASMLYIISFFAPDILENEQATMREIVDKHFADNWIISYYLGYTADLSLCWAPFSAAAAALANTVQLGNISKFANLYNEQVHTLSKKLDQFLTEVSFKFIMNMFAKRVKKNTRYTFYFWNNFLPLFFSFREF
jgi:WASH complex subunit strumpellin